MISFFKKRKFVGLNIQYVFFIQPKSLLLAGLNCVREGVTHRASAQWHTPCQEGSLHFGTSLFESNRFLMESK